jgi:ribosomal protein S16
VIEQVGTYDPMPNQDNQKLVSFNYERIRHWLGRGAHLSDPVAELLGIMSIFIPTDYNCNSKIYYMIQRNQWLSPDPPQNLYELLA